MHYKISIIDRIHNCQYWSISVCQSVARIYSDREEIESREMEDLEKGDYQTLGGGGQKPEQPSLCRVTIGKDRKKKCQYRYKLRRKLAGFHGRRFIELCCPGLMVAVTLKSSQPEVLSTFTKMKHNGAMSNKKKPFSFIFIFHVVYIEQRL